ncbi:MAG: winged helix DNA-binding protein [Proteobacteria bacterium]|nr:winged helix DNA-binding protein [Pseudomonadota bacterium]
MTKRDAAGKNADSEQLSELELSLTVLWNSTRRWMSRRANSKVMGGLSDLDVVLLHLLVYRNCRLRGIDLAFALSIDDLHLVSYSLKKLARLGVAASSKAGKEVFYEATDAGRAHYVEFLNDRKKYLEPALQLLSRDFNIETLTTSLRTLSSAYEQAARSAASARGI